MPSDATSKLSPRIPRIRFFGKSIDAKSPETSHLQRQETVLQPRNPRRASHAIRHIEVGYPFADRVPTDVHRRSRCVREHANVREVALHPARSFRCCVPIAESALLRKRIKRTKRAAKTPFGRASGDNQGRSAPCGSSRGQLRRTPRMQRLRIRRSSFVPERRRRAVGCRGCSRSRNPSPSVRCMRSSRLSLLATG